MKTRLMNPTPTPPRKRGGAIIKRDFTENLYNFLGTAKTRREEEEDRGGS